MWVFELSDAVSDHATFQMSVTKGIESSCSKKVKVFRYSFSEVIPIFFSIPLKMILSLFDRYEIFTTDCFWIEVCQNVVVRVESISL